MAKMILSTCNSWQQRLPILDQEIQTACVPVAVCNCLLKLKDSTATGTALLQCEGRKEFLLMRAATKMYGHVMSVGNVSRKLSPSEARNDAVAHTGLTISKVKMHPIFLKADAARLLNVTGTVEKAIPPAIVAVDKEQ